MLSAVEPCTTGECSDMPTPAATVPHVPRFMANTYPSYLRKIETLNNKLLRILQNKPYNSPSNNLYVDYNTLSIPDLHISNFTVRS